MYDVGVFIWFGYVLSVGILFVRMFNCELNILCSMGLLFVLLLWIDVKLGIVFR